MKNLLNYEFKLETLFKKIGIKLFILVFFISRVFDSITTEILLGRGYHEHYENWVFYSIENHIVGYFVTSVITFLVILTFLFLYYKFKKNNFLILNFISIIGLWFFFFFSWIPVINNSLLIFDVFPPFNYEFYEIFTIALPILFAIYGILEYNVIIQKIRGS